MFICEAYQQYDTLWDWNLAFSQFTSNPSTLSSDVDRVLYSMFQCVSSKVSVEPSRSLVRHNVTSLLINFFTGRLPRTYTLRYMCLFNLSEHILKVPRYQAFINMHLPCNWGQWFFYYMWSIERRLCLGISFSRVYRMLVVSWIGSTTVCSWLLDSLSHEGLYCVLDRH
jgi:hypothetical protein